MDAVFRTLVGFFLLLVLTRVMGKKQLGQLTVFTYITGIAMGNMAGDMIIHKDVKILDGITGMVLWSVLIFLIEFVSMKSAKARVLLDGEPTIVIKKGQIIADSLKSLRLNIDDLSMLLRTNDIFTITDVEYAILEPNGELSILKKPDKEQPTKKDMNISSPGSRFLPTELIVDGKLVPQNLKELGLTSQWLNAQLAQMGIQSIKEVLFAELQPDNSVYLQRK